MHVKFFQIVNEMNEKLNLNAFQCNTMQTMEHKINIKNNQMRLKVIFLSRFVCV